MIKQAQAAQQPPFPALDPLDERLLELLGRTWLAGVQMTVMQVMQQAQGMSSTTTHRRLKSLRERGFITLVTHEDDQRIKHVTATAMTERWFAMLGECISLA